MSAAENETPQATEDQSQTPRGFDARDTIGLIGLVLIGLGFLPIYPPLSFLVPGAILVRVAILGVRS